MSSFDTVNLLALSSFIKRIDLLHTEKSSSSWSPSLSLTRTDALGVLPEAKKNAHIGAGVQRDSGTSGVLEER